MSKEEIKKTEVKDVEVIVVEALPQQQIKEGADESGKVFHFVTRDEALTEILKIVRELKKGITG